MRELYGKIIEVNESGGRSALCTVIQTRGSTPQGPGCKMLVLPNAQTLGTIGGGCVEAEVRRRALRVLESGVSEALQFQLDHDYGWDDGLICGGTMRVFVDVLDGSEVGLLYRELLEWIERKEPAVLGTRIWKDTGPLAERFLYLPKDHTFSGKSPPLFSSQLVQAAEKAIRQQQAIVVNLKASETGEPVQVFLEPVLPRPSLVIAGAGHVGRSLARIGAFLDFEVTVIDDRESCASRDRFPEADHIVVSDIPRALKELSIGENSYVVIVTRGHLHDQDALYSVIEQPAAYLGLIGSRRKIKLIFDEFRRLGVPEEALERVHAPIGLDIGSETVPEIALSIAAEMVFVRSEQRKKGVHTGKPSARSLSKGKGPGAGSKLEEKQHT